VLLLLLLLLLFRDLVDMDRLSKSDPLVAVWVKNVDMGAFELAGHTEFAK
jgi:hypothetical protein